MEGGSRRTHDGGLAAGGKPGPQAPSAAQGTSQTPAAGPEELGGFREHGKEAPSVSQRVLATALTAAARDVTSRRRLTRRSVLRRPDGTRRGPDSTRPAQRTAPLGEHLPQRAPSAPFLSKVPGRVWAWSSCAPTKADGSAHKGARWLPAARTPTLHPQASRSHCFSLKASRAPRPPRPPRPSVWEPALRLTPPLHQGPSPGQGRAPPEAAPQRPRRCQERSAVPSIPSPGHRRPRFLGT